MSKLTYTTPPVHDRSDDADKPLVWLHGEIKTPPFGPSARLEAGLALRRLQRGERLAMPHSRPMPGVRTVRTPTEIIEVCRQRLRRYDDAQEKTQSPGS